MESATAWTIPFFGSTVTIRTRSGSTHRETKEELGVHDFFKGEASPFLLTITQMENVMLPCKEHYDVWFLLPTDGRNFNIDPTEFHETRWLAIDEARKLVTDAANVEALNAVERLC